MSSVVIKGNASGTGSVTIESPNTNSDFTATLSASSGTILIGASPTVSSTNTVTNKIAIVINGTTYYLLASTSGT